MIERIKNQDKVLAIIIRSSFQKEGIEFFTPDSYSQQMGYMQRPKGYKIEPHVHLPVSRKVDFTKEVLFIKSGKVRADFYDDNMNYIESTNLEKGDVILLAYGGHGFKIIEKAEIIEVKQGPYAGEMDKKRFNGINTESVKLKK